MTHARQALPFAVLSLAVAGMGVYVAQADDAPGAAVVGALLMVAGLVLGLKRARGRLPRRVAFVTLALGVGVAAGAAYLTHSVVVRSPLFANVAAVPSTKTAEPAPQYAAAVQRGRSLARAAVLEQNLPGLSVAVGTNGTIVWAEGFGWRDIDTRAPVTPDTRFTIGTAAATIASGIEPLGLKGTGRDAAALWSPGHIGEPEEDFPGFTMTRRVIFRPLGLAPAQPLPGDRATFYVPRTGTDPRAGRRLMYMRDLACCVNGLAFSSTPSDLVRYALTTDAGVVNGDLAGGRVMTLIARGDSGVSLAVTSNIAHADTAALAHAIADAFAEPRIPGAAAGLSR